ncbi:MAG: prephenate dehydrogenase [Epsilonproteobacteria bacterium]|nr:prephenate dehydrogenase [Campylobacterota bacterium]
MILGIVGLGLMGGSFALAVRQHCNFSKIVGLDHNLSHTNEALELKLVDEIITFEEITQCDVIVLAIPICAIINTLQQLALLPLRENVTIIDFGSTKEEIIQKCPINLRHKLVASHPMAGTEYSGPKAAIRDLYDGKIMVVCDVEETNKYQLNVAFDIYKQLNMQIKIMYAAEHDRHAAFISHMPHIVSYSLANAVLKQEDNEHIVALAAGGFKSMARLAKSNPKMWEEIFWSNEENLLDAIEAFIQELKKAKKLIKKQKRKKLYKWMQKGNKLHKILK